MDRVKNLSGRQAPAGAQAPSRWGDGRIPPPPLSMQEGASSGSSGYFYFGMEDRSKIDAFLGLAFRSFQWLFSLVGWALLVSAGETVSYHTGFTKVSVDLRYDNFAPFTFLLGVLVMTWLWSTFLILYDLLVLGCGWDRLSLARWRIWVGFSIDATLLILSFGAGCAAAGVTSIKGLVCDSQIASKFCRNTTNATIFGFIAWVSLIPSFSITLICLFREYN